MSKEVTITYDGYALPVGTWVWGCLRYDPKYNDREYKGEKLLLNASPHSVFVFFFDRKECTKYIKNIGDVVKKIAKNPPIEMGKMENEAILKFASTFDIDIDTIVNFINQNKSNQ